MAECSCGPAQGESSDDGKRKDANEVLLRDGRFALRKLIDASKAWPIEGLYSLSSFRDKIWDLYDGRNFEKPVETGWPVLNEFYRVVPGELTIVTGAPPCCCRHAAAIRLLTSGSLCSCLAGVEVRNVQAFQTLESRSSWTHLC